MVTSTATTTPISLLSLPNKSALIDAFVGKPISAVRTPALIVDRSIFKANCERVTAEVKRRGMRFRAHVKSLFTPTSASWCTADEWGTYSAQDDRGYEDASRSLWRGARSDLLDYGRGLASHRVGPRPRRASRRCERSPPRRRELTEAGMGRSCIACR